MAKGCEGSGEIANGEYHTYPRLGGAFTAAAASASKTSTSFHTRLTAIGRFRKPVVGPALRWIAKYETRCLKENLKPLRTRLKMQSRHKVPANLCVKIAKRDGRIEYKEIPEGDYPVMAFALCLPPAGILTGEPPTDTSPFTLRIRTLEGDEEKVAAHIAKGEAARLSSIRPHSCDCWRKSPMLIPLPKLVPNRSTPCFGTSCWRERPTLHFLLT